MSEFGIPSSDFTPADVDQLRRRALHRGEELGQLRSELSKLRARLADRERRIRHAARKLTAWCRDEDQGGLVEAAMALDMRYSLPKRRPLLRGKRK